MMSHAELFKTSLCALAVCTTVLARGEETSAPAEEKNTAEVAAPAAKQQGVAFLPLVQAVRLRGSVQVTQPGRNTSEVAVTGKFYPLGTLFETGEGALVTLGLSVQDRLTLFANTALSVGKGEKGADVRIAKLLKGEVKTFFRDNPPEGALSLVTPNAVLKNMTGKGEYLLKTDGTEEIFHVATITGSSYVEGAQFTVPALRAANTVTINTSADRSLSRLSAESGEFNVLLAKGEEAPVGYKMSPQAVIKIWREHAAIGGRLIVSTLVVNPKGAAEHRFAFAEGRPQVATGELIAPKEEPFAEEELPVLLSGKKDKESGSGEKQEDAAAEKDEKKEE